MDKPTRDEFLKHVEKHELRIALDTGVHRHLVFRQPGTANRQFEIVTWPGYLAYTGDMGSFVFWRTEDMLTFFRGEDINPSYWSEKIEATCKTDGHRAFSATLYRKALRNDFAAWDFDTDAARSRAWNNILADGLDETPDSLEDALRRATAYQCPHSDQRFTDFWDHQLTDYTYRFIWCCHALVWGIQQYDAAARKAA